MKKVEEGKKESENDSKEVKGESDTRKRRKKNKEMMMIMKNEYFILNKFVK